MAIAPSPPRPKAIAATAGSRLYILIHTMILRRLLAATPTQLTLSCILGVILTGVCALAYAPSPSLSNLLPALSLAWTGLILSSIGHAALDFILSGISRMRPKGTSSSTDIQLLSAAPSLSLDILCLIGGQTICMVWIYLRSVISGTFTYALGVQLPGSKHELFVIALVILCMYWRRSRAQLAHALPLARIALLVLVLICTLAPLAVRDLPRTVGLSSDPDQHAFWAFQVYQLGLVPWDQGLTGAGPFGYPAGFAVLNAIWMAFSGLNAVEVVTIQPMLQFLLAVLLCAALSPLLCPATRTHRLMQDKRASNWGVIFTSLCALVAYWTILPYGLQSERFHGEGTARLSTAVFSAVSALLLVIPRLSTLNSHIHVALPALAAITLALLATINPLSVTAPAVVAFPFFIRYTWWAIRSCVPKRAALAIGLAALLAAATIAGEPFIVAPVTKHLGLASASVVSTSEALKVSLPSLSLSLSSVIAEMHPQKLASILFAGTRSGVVPTAIATTACCMWLLSATGPAARWILAVAICALISVAARSLHFPSATDATQHATAWYLIAPYIHESALQMGAVLAFILLLVCVHILQRWIAERLQRALLLLPIGGLLFFSYEHWSAAHNSSFNLKPRACVAGVDSCLTEADLTALRSLRHHTEQVRLRYPQLTYNTAPKVLILGTPITQGAERWVFPSGAARVVPLYSALPVAFFYGRGHPEWSYENYLSRICRKLDPVWLKERNVRFLFLGQREPGCMKRRREIVQRSKTLYEHQGVRILELVLGNDA